MDSNFTFINTFMKLATLPPFVLAIMEDWMLPQSQAIHHGLMHPQLQYGLRSEQSSFMIA